MSRQGAYNEDFNIALQHLWGDGFLSPGGADEVATMLEGVSLNGLSVLDVGSGLGACAVLMAGGFGAASVLGVDVEEHLIEQSTERAEQAGLADRAAFLLIDPGPLPFPDASFDAVFTKDAMVHMPDKAAFCTEVARVLKPGGIFVGSDWLRGGEATATERALGWLEFVHLDFRMKTKAEMETTLADAGFTNIRTNDRNEWYRTEILNEIAAVSDGRFDELASKIGAEDATYRRESSLRKQEAIDDGFLRPTHFFGLAPTS